jgi:hypothetical protein
VLFGAILFTKWTGGFRNAVEKASKRNIVDVVNYFI